jgi:phospholipase/carboxylesterase
MQIQQFGPLRARVAGGSDGRGGGAGPLVVLLHGYGAPGDDLVALARYLRAPSHVRFLFPEAPLAIDDGRAWWPLDLELFARRARGERIDRSDDLPATLPQIRAQLLEHLEEAGRRLSAAPEQMLLGGFSQGSMLACDVALHASVAPRGLILMSSTLIARSQWEPRMESRAGLPIVQTHGTHDPLLDYRDAVRLRDLWREHGAEVTFVDFDGGHEIPPPALQAVQHFIAQHAPLEAP